MKISYNWLKRYLKTDLSVAEAEEILTATGLEVESMEYVEEIPGGLKGVVVGEVKECRAHPDADKLSVTKVDIGEGELLNIVCGAPNVAEGQKVFVATVGTILSFSSGETLKIKKSKIRGVQSVGMICAEDELGLGESHDGILVLDKDASVGVSAANYLKLESDAVFEIGLTPNRIDAASHIGVARDLYAWLNFNERPTEFSIPDTFAFDSLKQSGGDSIPVDIEVEDISGAPKYYGITLDNIKVGPSPRWMQKILRVIGLRPINNVVDITNFILHETGHPLHAFDHDKISGNKVIVRRANDGESFVTLDGVERKLSREDLMICDEKGPMCMAGIFGGADSGVTEKTTSVFLESAYFDPVSIRKSSKRHGLKTDASFRYERGADPEALTYALKRAVELLCECAGATISGDIVMKEGGSLVRSVVDLDYERMEKIIGKAIGGENILNILKYLDYEITEEDEQGCVVSVPMYRVDVTRECDVVEDVLRIYGYNNIDLPKRMSSSLSSGTKPDPARVKDISADFLVNNGFYETMNNSLTRSEYYNVVTSFSKDNLVRVMNPLSSDLNCMRQTLLFNGLEVVAHNVNRQHNRLKIFEFGNVYHKGDNNSDDVRKVYRQKSLLSCFVTGPDESFWKDNLRGASYFELKGYVEALFRRFGLDIMEMDYTPAPSDLFSEGLTILTKGGKELAVMGNLKKKILKQFDIKQPVYASEINWDLMFKLISKQKVSYRELPKYPSVTRDLALLLNEGVSYSDIYKCAFSAEKKLLKRVVLFDVYRGDKIPEGKKQYAVSFTLRDDNKTLTDKYVEKVMNKLLDEFSVRFGASLR